MDEILSLLAAVLANLDRLPVHGKQEPGPAAGCDGGP